MSWGDWLVWGFLSTMVLTTLLSLSHGIGITRISLPYLLGTMLSASRRRARVLGFGAHVVAGWLFALLYVAAFELLGEATWWMGLIGGLVHSLAVLTAGMQLMPALHPRMASVHRGPTVVERLEPPGFLALHYGAPTPATIVFAHLVFGALFGALYDVSA